MRVTFAASEGRIHYSQSVLTYGVKPGITRAAAKACVCAMVSPVSRVLRWRSVEICHLQQDGNFAKKYIKTMLGGHLGCTG